MKKIFSLCLILILIASSTFPSLAATVSTSGGRTIEVDAIVVN